MAGIGFRLERLAYEGGLGTNVAVLLSGTVLSTGHWIMTIFGIGITMFIIRSAMSLEQLETLLLLVVYGFAIASVATGACLLPAIRRFSNAMFKMRPETTPAQFFSASFISGGLALAFAFLIFALFFGVPFRLVLAGAAFSALVSLLWSAAAFCSAIQSIGFAFAAYCVGTVFGLSLAITSAFLFGTVEAVIWSYTAGLSATLGLLTALILRDFPFDFTNPLQEIATQLRFIRTEIILTLGALSAALAVWSSTLVIWSSPFGHTASVGLRYSPLYDAAFFFGLLAMIPGLTLMTIFFETELFRRLRKHLALIEDHGTMDELDRSEKAFSANCMKGMGRLMLMQAVVSLLMLAMLPMAVEGNLLQHRQLPLARLVALGTIMHMAILACSMVLIYLDAVRQYTTIHLVFLGSTTLATIALLPIGERAFGLSYLIGSSIAALFAIGIVSRLLNNLNAFLFASALRRSVEEQAKAKPTDAGVTRGVANA